MISVVKQTAIYALKRSDSNSYKTFSTFSMRSTLNELSKSIMNNSLRIREPLESAVFHEAVVPKLRTPLTATMLMNVAVVALIATIAART